MYAAAEDLRLPGYIGYSSTTPCTRNSCETVLCLVSEQPQDKLRCLVYERLKQPHTHIDVANITAGAIGCCAVTVQLRGVDTTVALVYVRPTQWWDSNYLITLTALLGYSLLLCGDRNAHHTTWGSRNSSQRGNDLVDVIN